MEFPVGTPTGPKGPAVPKERGLLEDVGDLGFDVAQRADCEGRQRSDDECCPADDVHEAYSSPWAGADDLSDRIGKGPVVGVQWLEHIV